MSHPEDFCDDCGEANHVWWTLSWVWNVTVRDPMPEEGPDPMLCAGCFIRRAESAGISAAWRVEPENVRTYPPVTNTGSEAPDGPPASTHTPDTPRAPDGPTGDFESEQAEGGHPT